MLAPDPLPSKDEPLAAGSLVDGFRVVQLLGEGASGRVYLAQDLALGRRVALKFLRPELLGPESAAQLLEEARTTARFSHPHIVTVHAAGTFREQPYLALEYLEGQTLRERMARERLPPAEVLRVGRAIADALAEAHRHGIIHADLKPENVLLPRDGRLRVVDFGLARHAGASAGAASGTPAYMSPERWQGALPSPAMDIWALGVMLHELLEGRRPVDDASLASFAFAPRPLPGPSPERAGAALIKSCLELAPAARPSAEALTAALSALLDPSGGAKEDDTARTPFRGLRAFTEAEAALFSGREAEVDALVERLRHDGPVALVGPSGIGKSSLLQAGLFSRLRQMAPWTVVSLRPGAHPLQRLVEALALEPSAAERLARTPGAIVELLQALAPAPALLAVDAFEEAFTLATSEETLALARCLAAVATAGIGWRVMVVLRDDYLGHFARLSVLSAFLGNAFVVGPLSPSALGEAIAGPLRRAGYATDDAGLVGRIVSDVQAQPAGLPLLQATCAALWERRDKERRLLRASVYEELGGVAGALAAQGRQLLGQLPAQEVRTVRALLLQMLTPEGTRRPRTREELLEELGQGAGRVLDALLSHRLVVASRDLRTDGAVVELAHEALATAWPELARWRQESREEHLLVTEIDQAAELWDRRGRRDEETWGGDALSQALRRVEHWKVPLASRSRAFLEAARRREQGLARRRRVGLTGAVSLLVVTAVVVTAAVLAFRQKQQETARQQVEMRLMAVDLGDFDLVLELYDFDPGTQAWTRVPATGPLEWSLAPQEAAGAGAAYDGSVLKRGEGRVDEQGAWRERVEAPSRAAWLSVKRGACPPSRVRLQRLPGYAQRKQHGELRLPIPTCAASRAGLIEVPAGTYWRPLERRGRDARVEVAAFAMDRTEVTNGQFRLFQERVLPLSGGQRETAPAHERYKLAHALESPATGIDAFTAEDFCRFLGKELPTIDEWKKAARGGEFLDADGAVANPNPLRVTVWGDDRPEPPANLGGKDPFPTTAPVGSFPEDRSPYGILDMAGNVAEWTATTATEGDFPGLRMVAGGRWDAPVETEQHQMSWTNHLPARRFEFGVGARCVERSRPH
ncbi:bifunctional serine/threonine-protein kinase/formylglycine-generating enzyme family protein [Hyalangium gracile]|uniref:bifunctional serine/threonine-protein kinase/formylglycine-generating enzyme family protein n=1 Tax=Hyalangium gracile TaxID=394092 RepID=UPI001CCDE4B2|nr:bifunctional serine/threonine-protein kinase/formylglycine-generating enzyme family protein [Hyalangium gracile]